jgi:poly(A) polymerase/tRNA nucleotidyltransferase (CCA-adding enzyme)
MSLRDKNLYYVGGVVRDSVLGLPSFDIDYCYEGDAIEFSSHFDVIKTNPQFGTVRILYDGKEVDIASTREEVYPKAGHLPKVANIGCPLKEDLKRRDFTINAMAKNTVTGEIIDYFGGMDDIRSKTLRVLHDRSFIDDPTRIIRALKFSVRFGFELDEHTKQLQNDYLDNINYDMSYHRIKKELKETFNLNKPDSLVRFVKQGIYKLLGNNILSISAQENICNLVNKIEYLVSEFNPNNPWLVYMGLFNLSNINLTSEEKMIIENIPFSRVETDFEIYKLFTGLPVETVLLYGLKYDLDIALKYLRKLRYIKLEITGEDLKNLGINSGKIYKEIFNFVLERKLKQSSQVDKSVELEWVRSRYLV